MSMFIEQEGRDFLREVSVPPISEFSLAMRDFRTAFGVDVRSLVGKNPGEPISEAERQLLARMASNPGVLLTLSSNRITSIIDHYATALEREVRIKPRLDFPPDFPIKDKVLGRLGTAVEEDLNQAQAREQFGASGLRLAQVSGVPLNELFITTYEPGQSLNPEQVIGLIIRKSNEAQ